MESKPSEPKPTTSKPTTNEPAGWDTTFFGSDGKTKCVIRLQRAPALGLVPLDDGRIVSVVRVVCSACGRGAHAFNVAHNPQLCDELRNAPFRPLRVRGVPSVLPHDRRTRAYRTVRRELGLLVE